jgi:hypothetical protein
MGNLGNNFLNSLLYYNVLVFTLFKNTDANSKSANLQKILEPDFINSLFYSDPFLKAGFISKLIQDSKLGILYLDFDLLYSGYLTSGALSQKENLSLFQPTTETLYPVLKEILVKASLSQNIIIIDSLNGLYNILNRKKNIGKTAMSFIMLLKSIAKTTQSYVVVASMARYKKKEGWILSPTGKHIIETKNSKKILLEYCKEGIELDMPSNSSKIIISSNLIPLI